jgi:cytochrome c oxidase subunit 2
MLQNLYGKQVTLQSGETALVDEAYIRESILTPGAKVTAGFQPIMPTFQGLVSEEGLLQLIEYVKSLKTDSPGQAVRPTAGGPAPNENTPAQAPGRN